MPKYQQIYVLPYGNIYPQAFCQPIAFPCGSNGKESTCNAGHSGSTPELGRPSVEGTGNPLQYSCLENLLDSGAWQAMVNGVAKSWTRLSN